MGRIMEHTIHGYINTSQGKVAVAESKGGDLDVLFIHGNSTCAGVFKKQFADPLSEIHHFVGLDLPGHGESDDAVNASRTYSRPGLADVCLETVDKLNLRKTVIVGWSLGGHVAIEMLSRSKSIASILVVGTPPVGDNMAEGFRGRPLGGLASKAELTAEEADQFAMGVLGACAEPFVRQAVERTDRRFRPTLLVAAAKGEGANQRSVLGSSDVPVAIINGADDHIINLDYIDSVEYKNLWCGRCFRIPDAAHAPFWQAPEAFNLLLSSFLGHIADS